MRGSTDPAPAPKHLFIVSLSALFLLRVAYGLASDFWADDPRQTFLVGLVAFARHRWPYFGADVVWTESRLPGALQGLLIAVPLAIWRAPEAPILLLNALSFAALSVLGWYVGRRLPALPRWFVWGTLMTLPWTMNFSTDIINTSYILPGAILFFVGFFEAMPALSANCLPPTAAWAAMGFGLLWSIQIHLSWVLLPAYLVVAGLTTLRRGAAAVGQAVMGFLAGAALPAACLIPTLAAGETGGTARNVELHARSLWRFGVIVAQFLSFPSYELNRFVGQDTAERLVWLADHWWLAPAALFLLVLGVLQPVVLAIDACRQRPDHPEWSALRITVGATVLWIYASYFFSIKEPLAHAFYVTFPLAAIYAMTVWERYAHSRAARRFAAVTLGVNMVFLVGFAIVSAPARSLYRQRTLVVRALDERNDRVLGERRWADTRQDAVERPEFLPPSVVRTSPREDLGVTVTAWAPAAFGYASVFDLSVLNRGQNAAYLDVQYVSHYFDRDAVEIETHHGVLSDIIEPGTARRWPRLVDGRANPRAVRATIDIVDAEHVIPDGPAAPHAGASQ